MNEFVKQNDQIFLNVPYAEAYIPYSLFDDPESNATVASYYGEGIHTIGLFNIRFYQSDEDARDSVPLRTFNYPNTIDMYPTTYTKEKLILSVDMEEDAYIVLKFYKGDVVMNDLVKKASQNCEKFLNLLIQGKIPKGIEYTDIFFMWIKNLQINSVNPGVPSITMQIIISENARSKNNSALQFRKIAGKEKTKISDYRIHNMVDVAGHNSVMSALTFNYFSDMLTNSINMTKSGEKQNKSPLEKVLSM